MKRVRRETGEGDRKMERAGWRRRKVRKGEGWSRREVLRRRNKEEELEEEKD